MMSSEIKVFIQRNILQDNYIQCFVVYVHLQIQDHGGWSAPMASWLKLNTDDTWYSMWDSTMCRGV